MNQTLITFGALAAAVLTISAQHEPDPRRTGQHAVNAQPVLTAARVALGGETRLSGVKTFTATGRTRQLQGNNLVPIEFEVSCELPDRCVRRDEVPARESGPTTIGFSGDQLIQFPVPPTPPAFAAGPARGAPSAVSAAPPGRGAPAPGPGRIGAPPAPSRVAATKQDFAKLWLGMFASSFASYPIAFTFSGVAEAPQGQAFVLDAKGPENFAARLFLLRDTHLPVMLTWQAAAAGQRGAPPAAPVEHRLYYADYRDLDGMKLPFRLRRAVGTDTVEETTFDGFRINARIDPRVFEIRK
jgi:hypothetical protein